ncbi:hypothetical protein [Pseudofrankia sp. DC12]|uniref:hypothetical protein n=1 Tax=Pseudofrankia sp. DC12 TaxID=683315 RepID=UPI0012FB3D95|nr:hypothetical protein [Pseudofrankia sp. DC12]
MQQNKQTRLRVMNAIYQEVGDDTQRFAHLWAIRDSLGLHDEDMGRAVDYLEGEGLIKALRTIAGQRTPMHASITHYGFREMEESTEHPDQATQYFPPFNSMTINIANVSGSALQIGSPGATQRAEITNSGSTGGDALDQIREFVDEYIRRLPELQQEISPEALAELAPRVATVQKQIESPEPERHILTDTLSSIKSVLEHAGGGIAAGMLLALLHFHGAA